MCCSQFTTFSSFMFYYFLNFFIICYKYMSKIRHLLALIKVKIAL